MASLLQPTFFKKNTTKRSTHNQIKKNMRKTFVPPKQPLKNNFANRFYVRFSTQIIAVVAVLLFLGCSKDDPPAEVATVVTTEVSDITFNTATFTGEITANGGSELLSRGACWSLTENPTIDNSKTIEDAGTGVFTSALTELLPETTYYLRAYATNTVGTSYGAQLEFTTNAAPIELPTITSTAVTTITHNTANSGGNVTDNGGAVLLAKGVCWSLAINPTTTDAKTTDGPETGAFVSSVTELLPSTTYYLRAYATNSVGTVYGDQIEFTTIAAPIVLPTISSTALSAISTKTAQSGGDITANGGAAILEKGVCWSLTTSPTTADAKTLNGTGIGPFTSNITNLTPNTTYYLRAYATNSEGTAYGTEMEFTTLLDNVFTGSVYLKNQQEVDAFGAHGYTQVTGDLHVEPAIPTTFSNLNGLSTLTSIGGALYLSKTKGLPNFSAMKNLVSVGDDVNISHNEGLTSIGLAGLTTIGGDMSIILNQDLLNLNGLEKLAAKNGNPDLTIWNNAKLSNFCGLKPLFSNFNGILSVLNNAYNPSIQEIATGNCSQ